jgi:hypothetical protein
MFLMNPMDMSDIGSPEMFLGDFADSSYNSPLISQCPDLLSPDYNIPIYNTDPLYKVFSDIPSPLPSLPPSHPPPSLPLPPILRLLSPPPPLIRHTLAFV